MHQHSYWVLVKRSQAVVEKQFCYDWGWTILWLGRQWASTCRLWGCCIANQEDVVSDEMDKVSALVLRCIYLTISARIIVRMPPANERRRYIVTSSLIGWAHAQKAPYFRGGKGCAIEKKLNQHWSVCFCALMLYLETIDQHWPVSNLPILVIDQWSIGCICIWPITDQCWWMMPAQIIWQLDQTLFGYPNHIFVFWSTYIYIFMMVFVCDHFTIYIFMPVDHLPDEFPRYHAVTNLHGG